MQGIGQIKFMTTDTTVIGYFCNDLRNYINYIDNDVAQLKIQKNNADILMSLIKTEYRLNDE